MSNSFSSIPGRALRRLRYLYNKHVVRDEVTRGVDVWYQTFPGQRVLYDLGLPEQAVVVDIGGFIGEWTAACLGYCPTAEVHVFEPVPAYVAKLKSRFKGNRKVKVHDYALGGEDSPPSMEIGLLGEGSSAFRTGGATLTVPVKPVVETLKGLKLKHIDAMAINAEGGEYQILPSLCKSGMMKQVDVLWVQFHLVNARSRANHAQVCAMLERTHDCVIRVPFVWEKWVRRAKS